MNNSKTTYLSLGSNLGNKLNNLQEAVFAIQKKAGFITGLSAVYQTPALGFEGADFLNACLSLQTFLSPEQLLEVILEVETSLGRKRGNEVGYQPRTIDIDILYYELEVIHTENLVIPHPNLHIRRFVLRPLSDIAPQFYHPIINKDTRNLLQECPDKSVLGKTQLKLYKSKEDLFSKLQFITIEGNIGAGKTTLANMIADDFNAKLVLERFADNPFLPKFYEDQSRYAFPLEMSFLADRYQQFTDDTSQFDLFKNFMISDYDIYKSLIFANITLQKEEFSLYRKVFTFMHKEIKKPDIFIYLYQNSERLLSNIKKRGRDYEQNISADYLDKINRGYLDFIKSTPERKSLIIDVSKLDFVQNQKDYEYILDEIQKFTVSLP
ncbi:MAG: deoxyguanosine kinase [Sediminicola sp.]|jgi:deoxyguanosine kinase